ncbi:MAG: TIGR01212 family radical SAM protein [Tissierellia bacterium]|nr:TIGR01212 family radical SAM protein [Tissierellia bacterium]
MNRYLSFSSYFKREFNLKLYKLSLSSGLNCPNRIFNRPCLFCSEKGAGEFSQDYELGIKKQIENAKLKMPKRIKADKYIAYFQSFTNTYGDIDYLRKIFYEAISEPDIFGLAIATRADCLSVEVLNLLEELNEKTFLWLEIGMQSINENTVSLINRGYSHKTLHKMLLELKKRNIRFLLHLIAGLITEQKTDLLKSVQYVNEIKAWGVKFHSLYIQTDSELYNYYLDNPFSILTKDQYIDYITDAIGILNPEIVIHRLTGDAYKPKLYLPKWSADKLSVISSINRELKNKNIVQGSLNNF